MAIATGTSDPMLLLAVSAFEVHTAEFTGATARDRGEHLKLGRGKSSGGQCRRCVLPEAVRNGDHLLPRDRSLKESFHGLSGGLLSRLGQMQINRGGL